MTIPVQADDFSDLSDERPLPPVIDISHALPARSCDCGERALYDEGTCVRCGRDLPGEAWEAA